MPTSWSLFWDALYTSEIIWFMNLILITLSPRWIFFKMLRVYVLIHFLLFQYFGERFSKKLQLLTSVLFSFQMVNVTLFSYIYLKSNRKNYPQDLKNVEKNISRTFLLTICINCCTFDSMSFLWYFQYNEKLD